MRPLLLDLFCGECIRSAGVRWLPRTRIVRVTIDVDADLYTERFS